MAACAGGVFDQADDLLDQLRQGPAVEVQPEGTATPDPAGPPPSRWRLRTLRTRIPALQDYTVSGVWRLRQRCGIRLRSAQVRLFSPDPEYVDKEAYLLRCLHQVVQAPSTQVLVFLDEMGYYRWPEPATTWAVSAPAGAPCTQPAGTNQQWRIIGALNALTGRVDYADGYIVGRAKVIAFYRQLVQAYPDATHIYVVQDNWSIHRHAEVLAALQHLPQIAPVWLPTYAPWLNPIEKLWRWLRQDVLKLHRLADDWPGVRQRVNSFLDQFATGSQALLYYVGLLGKGKLAQALSDA